MKGVVSAVRDSTRKSFLLRLEEEALAFLHPHRACTTATASA